MTPSTQIVPFWHRLRAITMYPLQGAALWTLLALTGAKAVTFFLPGGFLFGLILWAGVYAYAVAILRQTANGRLDPPELAFDDGAGYAQIALQVVFFVMFLLGFAFLGPVGGIVFAIILLLAMPGATLSLAIDEDFGNAINPGHWYAIASRLGWPYFAVVALSAVIVISQGNAQAMLDYVMPALLSQVGAYFIATYAVFVNFHLMGYLIYQYHEELGFEIEKPAIMRRDPKADPDQDVLDEAAEMVLNGDAAGAEQMIERRLRARGGTGAVHAQYRKLLRLRGDVTESSRHGREYLNILMAQGQEKQALELVRDCLAIDPDFEPLQPEHNLPLARRAAETAQVQVAVQLTEAFAEYHPGHPDVAANAMLAAKLLAEKLGDERRAYSVLKTARATMGNHAEIDAYLQFLEKLAAPVARA